MKPNLFNKYSAKFIHFTKEDIWVGLKRRSGSSLWEYSDDTVATGQYSNWDVNYPTSLNQKERCAVMRKSNNKWYDIDCDSTQLFKFLCEKDADIQDSCTQYFSPTTGGGGNFKLVTNIAAPLNIACKKSKTIISKYKKNLMFYFWTKGSLTTQLDI
ncbi:hypothetical protein BpHYR1_035594 [Brachionus plicatilis]|uniref:C-type lectin domain-containing protein n=1 Tax=Brachionus plicatilis TaxID=10195 RepID=A0A3M7R9I4_BRAPC|nr:hypothetical protein BpHYR1_035594 [Brachionus plicatilis]